MKVVFLGNHTVGVRTLEAILERDEVTGIVAHPLDPEDGARYLSVFDFARKEGLNAVRMAGHDPNLTRFIQSCGPDLLWITDYRYLLPQSILPIAPLGAVNLHPSLLPKYRGRAPINWAILNGESQLGLTAHFVDEGMDTGDIIEQVPFTLREDQDVGDALEILYSIYGSVTRTVLDCFRSGQVLRRHQDHTQATVFPRRRPEDGLIDWNQSARQIRDLVRAVASPYPGAFSFLRGKKIRILSAALYSEDSVLGTPGEVIRRELEGFLVCAGRGGVLVKKAELADTGQEVKLKQGDILESI